MNLSDINQFKTCPDDSFNQKMDELKLLRDSFLSRSNIAIREGRIESAHRHSAMAFALTEVIEREQSAFYS